MSDQTRILVIGASGLIGRTFVNMHIDRALSILVRSAPGRVLPWRKVHVAHGNDWPKRIAAIKPDILVCAVGTTIKQAGSPVQFRAVDRDLVGACAIAARKAGARQMIAVSSVGASRRVDNLYLKTKGEMEAMVREQGFGRVDIFRPGLLTGPRRDTRRGEALAQRLAPFTDALMWGGLSRFRSMPHDVLARAMWAVTGASARGEFVHHHDEIRALAD